MGSHSVRKQNTSCDPCRRSKRRCAFPDENSGPTATCINCAHLGNKCTFDFVTARLNQRRNRATATTPTTQPQLLSPALPRTYAQHATTPLSELRLVDTTIQDALQANSFSPGFLDFDLFMGNVVSEWTSFDQRSFAPHDPPTEASPPIMTSSTTSPGSSASCPKRQAPSTPGLWVSKPPMPGLWRGSPIHLLNSSVETQRINGSLSEVYNSMISGIAVRYLDYNCNSFAGAYKYSFDLDKSLPGPSNVQPFMNSFIAPWRKRTAYTEQNLQSQINTPKSVANQINKVTMVGIARFLDNFGPLYGNNLDQKTRSQNERTLTAVVQAFALQYLPSKRAAGPLAHLYQSLDPDDEPTHSYPSHIDRSANSSHIFVSAWFNAYSHLIDTKQNLSFIRLYAVFLFQMTCVPEETASVWPCGGTCYDLLDDGLRQMNELKVLVDEYCQHLGTHSLYRFLLQSSLDIIRWFAYLRDTIDSVLHERPCMLEDAPVRPNGKEKQTSQPTHAKTVRRLASEWLFSPAVAAAGPLRPRGASDLPECGRRPFPCVPRNGQAKTGPLDR